LFSTFDLTSGFHQIHVNPRDVHKTAFVMKYGLYEYKTLPMGLCNGPPTCQRLMELVLNGLQWQICLIYLDDVIVFGSYKFI
jgi:putative transposase